MRELADLIPDYTTSEHFLFLNSDLKEHAEPVLHFFIEKSGSNPTFESFDKALEQSAHLNLPASVRKSIPHLVAEFFDFIGSSGRLPEAESWAAHIRRLETRYMARFREDGSVRGETFKKNYTDVGRNDPCPCGSGKKFKKCCMPLIG